MTSRKAEIESEMSAIQTILAEMPDSVRIERIGLDERLRELQVEKDNLALDTVRLVSNLTFRGDGVEGSRGIYADFGSKAAKSFSDAYSSVVAGLEENLRYMGRIPDRADHDLLITGTAIGSFGFTLELPPHEPDLLFEGHTIEETAIKKIREVLEVSSTGTDDDVAELVDAIHPRAVRKISDFMSLVATSNSTFALDIEGDFYRFDDTETLLRSATRLAGGNVKEYTEKLVGAFIGLLPKSRNFEFRTVDDVVYRGKLSGEIDNPELINDSYLGNLVSVKFDVVQVGQGRPRYTLTAFSNIENFTNK